MTASRCAALPGSTWAGKAPPDESTILRFRYLLEAQALTQAMFAEVRQLLEHQGLLLKSGTIVDANIIAAPPATKNEAGTRDPEMKQTRKGKQWHFGMKVHVGTDRHGLVHSLATGHAGEADITRLDELLHGQEQKLCGDRGLLGGGPSATLPSRRDSLPRQPTRKAEHAIDRMAEADQSGALRGFVLAASTPSMWSSACGALPKCVTAESTKTYGRSRCLRWPTCTWSDGDWRRNGRSVCSDWQMAAETVRLQDRKPPSEPFERARPLVTEAGMISSTIFLSSADLA